MATTGGADITNEYISFGLKGGLVAIFLSFLVYYRAYERLGRALKVVRSNMRKGGAEEHLLWGLGVMLAVHLFNWLGITYFDQFKFFWLLQMAAIASISQNILAIGKDLEEDEVEPVPVSDDLIEVESD